MDVNEDNKTCLCDKWRRLFTGPPLFVKAEVKTPSFMIKSKIKLLKSSLQWVKSDFCPHSCAFVSLIQCNTSHGYLSY